MSQDEANMTKNCGSRGLQKLVNKKIVIRAFNIIKRVRPDFRDEHSKVCILSRQNAHFALEKTSRKKNGPTAFFYKLKVVNDLNYDKCSYLKSVHSVSTECSLLSFANFKLRKVGLRNLSGRVPNPSRMCVSSRRTANL